MQTLKTSRRTTILLGALVAALAATQVPRAASWSPFASRQKALRQAHERVARLEGEASLVERAAQNLEAARAQSLPPDPSLSATLYHAWLIECLANAGHRDALVTPGRIGTENPTSARLPFAIESTTTAEGLHAFLQCFESSGLLHKILSMKIAPVESHADRVRVSLDVEALAMHDADPRDALLPLLPSEGAASVSDDRLLALLKRNPFFPPKPPTVEETNLESPIADIPRGPDPRSETVLIATLQRNGVSEAWLYNKSGRQHHVLRTDSPIPYLDGPARVRRIERSRIQVEDSEGVSQIEVGASLLDRKYSAESHSAQ
jgi:hypothetical protein